MNEPTLPNETLRQQLSALVDGELPGAEAELLVRRLARDGELKQAMSRYLLMGEALRQPNAIGPSRGFSAKVAAALEQDLAPATQTPADHGTRKNLRSLGQWLRPVAGVAVAAGVASLAVFVFRGPAGGSGAALTADTLEPVAVTAKRTESESYIVPSADNIPAMPLASAQLTNYVVAHSEYSSPLGRRNMLTGLLAGDDAESTAVDEESQIPQSNQIPQSKQTPQSKVAQ
jgi:sigma-E factor negative regulatory protein RseA